MARLTISDLLNLPATLNVEQAANVLGVSRGLAYEAVRQGEIPVLTVGRRRLVPTGRLLSMLGVGEIAEAVRSLQELASATGDDSR